VRLKAVYFCDGPSARPPRSKLSRTCNLYGIRPSATATSVVKGRDRPGHPSLGSTNPLIVMSPTTDNGVGKCRPGGSGKVPPHVSVWSFDARCVYSVVNPWSPPGLAGFGSGDTLARCICDIFPIRDVMFLSHAYHTLLITIVHHARDHQLEG
jgi:hypothetical protein